MAAVRRDRRFRQRPDLLAELSDEEVVEKYRLPRDKIVWLHELIRPDLEPYTARSHAIGSMTKLLTTLQFLAKGEFYSEGALTHGISKSSLCKYLWEVIDSINNRVRNIIYPTDVRSLSLMKEKFFRIAHLPNIIGAIDGTLVPILAPREREEVYVCRKGYHAINVQAVVDTDMRFLNIVARWPGSTHDSTIFDNCGLKNWIETGAHGWLIGDSGYALKPYMLTPKWNPTNPAEEAFNQAHSRTRMVVERSFGVLKSRFRCLHKTGGCLQFTPEKSAKVVTACARLHNLCLGDGLQPIELDHDNNNDVNLNVEATAQRTRENLINMFR